MSRGLLPRRLPHNLVRFGRLHPRSVVVAAVLAWVTAGLLASRVEVETDILSLLPRNNPVVEGFKKTVERFGSVDTLLVLSHYPGLRSVGAAAILGAFSTAVLGIALLPALLSVKEDS